MLCFRSPMHGLLGLINVSCLLSSKIIPSQSLFLLDLQSDFLSEFIHDMMSYGPMIFVSLCEIYRSNIF